ncbi:hypothetical protein R3P38DRAFT_3211162 [Favolaschia claudopus]|uniref:Peptidase A2 domain-containing protein n=1 Tax=Favolaschia claudopus TaxID=2862362 RepID=A0AAW0AG75_9AGAR
MHVNPDDTTTDQSHPTFVNPPYHHSHTMPNLGNTSQSQSAPQASHSHAYANPVHAADRNSGNMDPYDSGNETDGSEASPTIPTRMPKGKMPFGTPVRTILDLPLRGSKEAPKTFKGNHEDVEYFIHHYDKLIIKYNVTDPADQCECILEYCSTNVRAFIHASEHYQTDNWRRLRRELLKYYDAERASTQYKPSDITNYTLKTQHRTISNLSQWKRYVVKYKTMSGTLIRQGLITEANADVYFWLGIHKELRQILEGRILQSAVMTWSAPKTKQIREHHTMKEICDAAEWCFRRRRPEAMIVNAADYGIDYDDGYLESDEDNSDSGSDSESESRRRKKKREQRRKKKEESKAEGSRTKHKEEEKATIKPQGTAGEVTDLIRQLNRMQIDDAEYAPTYYSILALDQTGNAARCVKPPQIQNNWGNGGRAPARFNTREGSGPRVNSATQASTYPNNIPLGNNNRDSNRPAGNGPPFSPECFGCGKDDGHRMFDCGELKDLIQRGVVKHDEQTGKLRMADGTFIRRLPGEYIATAARRLATPKVMFGVTDYALNQPTPETDSFISHVVIREEDTDLEDEEDSSNESGTEDEGDVYLTLPRRRFQVNAADRSIPTTRVARKQAFDGVHVPKRVRFGPNDTTNKEQEDIVPAVVKAAPTKVKPGQMRDITNDVQPFDARQPRKVQEDVEMGEPFETNKAARRQPKAASRDNRHESQTTVKRTEDDGKKDATPPENAARRSEIQGTVHVPGIVERILDLELPMSVREALVASKEIRTSLQDVIRVKNSKAVLIGAQSPLVSQCAWPRSDGVLIRIEMDINGRLITAIIDTGSQLNVVRQDIAALVLHRPVDMTKTTGMNDANGGRGQLRGYINDVELKCGNVATKTGLWVSPTAPFELLLGRPWQRNNMVSIDERDEGTYLVFKDRETKRPRYELFAVPHEATSEVLNLQTDRRVMSLIADSTREAVAKDPTVMACGDLQTQQVDPPVTSADKRTENSKDVDLETRSKMLRDDAPNSGTSCNFGARPEGSVSAEVGASNKVEWVQMMKVMLQLLRVLVQVILLAGFRALLALERGVRKGERERKDKSDSKTTHLPSNALQFDISTSQLLPHNTPCLPPTPYMQITDNVLPVSDLQTNLISELTADNQNQSAVRGADKSPVQRAIEQRIGELEAHVLEHLPVRPRRGFGAVEHRPLPSPTAATTSIQAAAVEAYSTAEREQHPTVRPGELRSPQIHRLTHDVLPGGQDVYSTVFLNAELRIQDPATGELGAETGHAHLHFFKRPHERVKEWKMRAPYVSHRDVRRVTAKAKAKERDRERRIKTESHSPPMVISPLEDCLTLTKNRLQQGRQLLDDKGHYISLPIDTPSAYNTLGMSQVGLTTDGKRVVMKTSDDSLDRPGTPFLPAILHNNRPVTIPAAPPSSPIQTQVTHNAGCEPYVTIRRLFAARVDERLSELTEDDGPAGEMEVEEGEVVDSSLADAAVTSVTKNAVPSVADNRSGISGTDADGTTSEAEMADVSGDDKDQWMADRLRPIPLTKSEVAVIKAGYRNKGKPITHSLPPRPLRRLLPALPSSSPTPSTPSTTDSLPPLRPASPVSSDDSLSSYETHSSLDKHTTEMMRVGGNVVPTNGSWVQQLSVEAEKTRSAPEVEAPQPLPVRRSKFLDTILNPVDSDARPLPSTSNATNKRLPDPATSPLTLPPLDAMSSSAASAIYTPTDDKIVVPTSSFVKVIKNMHVTVSAGACDATARADAGIFLRRTLTAEVLHKRRSENMVDQWVTVPAMEYLDIIQHKLNNELNHPAMGRITYVNDEAYAYHLDMQRLDETRTEEASKVTIYLDDSIISTHTTGQTLIIDSAMMDAVSTLVGRDHRRLDARPTIKPLREGEVEREFSLLAQELGPEHCAGLNAFCAAQPALVNDLTDARGCLKRFQHRLITVENDRRLMPNTSILDHASPHPSALLTVAEHARMRISHASYCAHGYQAVSDVIGRVLHVQFLHEELLSMKPWVRRITTLYNAIPRSLPALPSPGLTIVLRLLSRPFERFPLVANVILAEERDYLPPGITAITLIGGCSYKWVGLAILPPDATRCALLWLFMRTVIRRLPTAEPTKGQAFHIRIYDHYRIFDYDEDQPPYSFTFPVFIFPQFCVWRRGEWIGWM